MSEISKEVLEKMIADGLFTGEMASKLGVARVTINRNLKKFGLKTRGHLGYKFTIEAKLKMSIVAKGKKHAKTLCSSCNHKISVSQINRHKKTCDGLGPRSLRVKNHNCQYCGKYFENPSSIGMHTVTCPERPGVDITINKMRLRSIGKSPNVETRAKISIGMKLAHKDGRAWNIGKSRWNNEPSYPEKFIMRVIANEGIDPNYEYEHPVEIYSIDFAWPKKMLALEIDGQQHQRFEECKLRDKRKDVCLTRNGWKIMRINWSEFYNDTKSQIAILKNIINNSPLVP